MILSAHVSYKASVQRRQPDGESDIQSLKCQTFSPRDRIQTQF